MTAWEGKDHMRDLLASDPEIILAGDDLERCFDLERIGESTRVVFDRLTNLEINPTGESTSPDD
jgi:hypothetical protein